MKYKKTKHSSTCTLTKSYGVLFFFCGITTFPETKIRPPFLHLQFHNTIITN
uniref:Uncharacterized protein n=1 Tax=Anguilla anguilla TaxID=7936 RepID=A0A0E9S5S4_ANGAN